MGSIIERSARVVATPAAARGVLIGPDGSSEEQHDDSTDFPVRLPGRRRAVTRTGDGDLAHLVRLTRPRRVLEVGMGYTTPFLAAELADLRESLRAKRNPSPKRLAATCRVRSG